MVLVKRRNKILGPQAPRQSKPDSESAKPKIVADLDI